MHVAVVGGGFSGTLLVHHLLAALEPAQKIFWFEQAPPFGRGIAYGSDTDAHLLNVAAQGMSALANHPRDLLDWWAAEGHGDGTDVYVPRPQYARYLAARCSFVSGPHPRVVRVEKEVAELRPLAAGDGEAWELVTTDGARTLAGGVALAVGHFSPMMPRVPGLMALSPAQFVDNPWRHEALAQIPATAEVACLGAGLTMVDVALQLERQGFVGRMTAVSRHGHWPHTHAERPSRVPLDIPAEARRSPAALCRFLRERAAAHGARGGDWRQVVDGLRPHTVALWRGFDSAQQARLLRHAKSVWDAHRHRVAPSVGKQLAHRRHEGRLAHLAGRLERAEAVTSKDGRPRLALHWRLRRQGEVWRQEVDVLVNCTGAHNVWPRAGGRLPRALLSGGIVRPGPHNLGLAMAPDGRLECADGRLHERAWSLGPARIGLDFESVAVPELREQAQALAGRMATACRADPSCTSRTRP